MLELSGLVMTVRPSSATSSSVYSTPFFSQSLTSSSSIGLEASEMSVSPLQKSSKPSPVPGPLTLISTSEPNSSLKISATTDEIGSTVEDPEIVIDPVSSPSFVSSVPSPHAAATSASASSAATTPACFLSFLINPSSGLSSRWRC
jgi:hypothetical protein